jgi:hypothetical protein
MNLLPIPILDGGVSCLVHRDRWKEISLPIKVHHRRLRLFVLFAVMALLQRPGEDSAGLTRMP